LQPRRRTAVIAIIVCALALHLFMLSLALPAESWRSEAWFFHIDHPYHQYQLELARALLRDGRLEGYDPFFGGGALGGLSSNVSTRLTVLLAWAMPDAMATATVYGLYIVLCALMPLLGLVWLARQSRWSAGQVAVGFVAVLMLWWTGSMRWYSSAGMASFVAAGFLAPAYAVMAYRECRATLAERPVALLLAGVLGGLGEWLHPMFGVLVVIVFLALLVVAPPVGFRRWITLLIRGIGLTAIVLLLSAPWLQSLVRAAGLASVNEQPYQKLAGVDVLGQSLGFGASASTGAWVHLLIGVALVGSIALRRRPMTALGRALVLAGLALLVFGSFGALLPKLGMLQPNRFLGPGYLMLALAVIEASSLEWRASVSSRIAPACVAVFALVFGVFSVRELYREVSPGSQGRHGVAWPEKGRPDPQIEQLRDWINENTTADARILFETSLGRVHGGGHIAGYLAATTRREFAGGAYPFFMPESSCWDKRCLGKLDDALSETDLQRYADVRNVGWVIAHSPELIARLDRWPQARHLAVIGKATVYGLDRPHSYVFQGTGHVVGRAFHRISVSGASGPELVLKYNWVPGLVTSPPVTVEAFVPPGSNLALIRIVSPPANFEVRLGN